MAFPISPPKFKLSSPYTKLIVAILATYAVQALWAHYVVGKDMAPDEWFMWWFTKIVHLARWVNTQWNDRHGAPS